MNVGEAKKRVIKIIHEYSNQGSLITDDENSDYLSSMNDFIDMAQKEIATTNSLIIKEFNISHFPIGNQLGETYSIQRHTDNDVIFQTVGSKAYYFEVSGYATVHIEEFDNGVWVAIKTIVHEGDNSFKAYKGLIESDNPIRIRFSGDYVYNFKNYALYQYKFPNVDLIPNFDTYVEYQLPSNYFKISRVVSEFDYGVYSDDIYKLERRNGLNYILLDRKAKGEYKVFYSAMPATILYDHNDPTKYDNVELEISEEAQQAMLYWVAYLCKNDTDTYMAEQYMQQYYVKINSIKNVNTTGHSKIVNVTGW